VTAAPRPARGRTGRAPPSALPGGSAASPCARRARSPPERACGIAVQIEFCAVGGVPIGLPIRDHQESLPSLPDVPRTRLHDNGVAIPAILIDVPLPIVERVVCRCVMRPCLDRQRRRDRIGARVRLVAVNIERNRDQRLVGRHKHKIHLVKGADGATSRLEVCDNLRHHRRGISQERSAGNVFIPGIVHRQNLHSRDNGIGFRGVEQDRVGDDGNGAQNTAGVIDTLRPQSNREEQQPENPMAHPQHAFSKARDVPTPHGSQPNAQARSNARPSCGGRLQRGWRAWALCMTRLETLLNNP